MTFHQFVIHNVLRNQRIYAAYFLSSAFTVMVFFTFAIFAFHPTFGEGNIDKNALFGMGVAGGIIYLFSFFFVLYSMGSFLQSRKKEFGLLMLQGMSMRQIRWMVFLENMFIGLLATVFGILTGTLFSKLILLIAENILLIEEALPFYFPTWAIIITFMSFIALFLVISFFITFVLRSKKLVDLIKGGSQSKGEPKASIILTVLAVLLLATGYTVALTVRGSAVVIAMIPVVIVVVFGTYFLFSQFSVFGIHFLKRRKSIFWKKTNMILLSDLSFRMKDNARTFFMVAIISTVAFSAIGTLFGFQAYLKDGLKETNPYSFSYVEYGDRGQTQEAVETVDHLLKEKNIKTEKVEADLNYFETQGDWRIFIAGESLYNTYADMLKRETIHLEADEIAGVEQSAVMVEGFEPIPLSERPVMLRNGEELKMTKSIQSEVLPEMEAHYVVSDELYKQLPEPVGLERHIAWYVTSGDKESIIEAGDMLTEEIEGHTFQATDYTNFVINRAYGPIMFIGLFIGIVFFISAGSFLYFRLFSDLAEDKDKFGKIAKMGLTDKELEKVITRQTAILFFAPIIVAVIHGAVALTALAHLFNYNLMRESSIVLGGFVLIQIVYYGIVRYVYTKQLKSVI